MPETSFKPRCGCPLAGRLAGRRPASRESGPSPPGPTLRCRLGWEAPPFLPAPAGRSLAATRHPRWSSGRPARSGRRSWCPLGVLAATPHQPRWCKLSGGLRCRLCRPAAARHPGFGWRCIGRSQRGCRRRCRSDERHCQLGHSHRPIAHTKSIAAQFLIHIRQVLIVLFRDTKS
jgi:hypothetical protein